MADNDQIQRIDLDTLTDEEVMKLDPAQVQALMSQGEVSNEPQPNDDEPDNSGTPEVVDDTPAVVSEPVVQADPEQVPVVPQADPKATPVAPAKPEVPKPVAPAPEPKTPVESAASAKVDAAGAMDFYNKVTATFKADGKDIQVRSAEDAVRLMQMGVNYSRRMQEMKPLRAMDNMLKTHGLNDPEKLNFLIDLSKGKPEAIQKLLKDKKIDPIDLDVTKEIPYKSTNYQADPKDVVFQDAIDSTLAADGGKDLIKDINSLWDTSSKEALREEPAIFQNLLEQKSSGVYGKIKNELEYQRTMGFLTDVPFLQAYHQVGAAMQKAGVFGSPKPTELQLQSVAAVAPIDTGTRKAVSKPKTETPNPDLSSITQPRVAPSNGGNQKVPDYSTLSDADFLKLAPPS